MWAIPTGIRHQFCFKKKKKKKSPIPESRVPETGSNPLIWSGRDSGRDKVYANCNPKVPIKVFKVELYADSVLPN